MTRHRRVFVALLVVAALPAARDAVAGPPTDQLKAHIDNVVKTLEDPAFKGEPDNSDS